MNKNKLLASTIVAILVSSACASHEVTATTQPHVIRETGSGGSDAGAGSSSVVHATEIEIRGHGTVNLDAEDYVLNAGYMPEGKCLAIVRQSINDEGVRVDDSTAVVACVGDALESPIAYTDFALDSSGKRCDKLLYVNGKILGLPKMRELGIAVDDCAQMSFTVNKDAHYRLVVAEAIKVGDEPMTVDATSEVSQSALERNIPDTLDDGRLLITLGLGF